MIELLAKVVIKDIGKENTPKIRQAYGILCGVVGISLNLILALGKFIAGLLSGSIAIMADAANNLSDAGSSLIVLFGFKLAGQKPDTDHPFGHGRMEYISGLVVSMLIMFMAWELMKSSIQEIFNPSKVVFEPVTLGILFFSILVKFYMFYYNRNIGKKIHSETMLAASMDSLGDMVATTVVLISMLLSHYFQWEIDGICGVLVAFLIFYAGITSAKETINPLLGQAPEPEFVEQIEKIVLSEEGIVGVHDLIVHNYGPGRTMISLHAEVPADEDIVVIHDVIDRVERRLKDELNCATIIHMDPISMKDEETLKLKEVVTNIVEAIDPVLTIHDFRIVKMQNYTKVIFDIVIPFEFGLPDIDVIYQVKKKIEEYNSHCLPIIEVDKACIK